MKKQYLEAGKIVNTHGVKGEVKIVPWTDTPEFFQKLETVYIDEAPVKLLSARVHKSSVIAQLSGVDGINGAMKLKGKVVYLNRDDVNLPPGGFFIQDIIGIRAFCGGVEIGRVAEVLNLPGQDVYVIRGEREYMIPAVPEFILDTDLKTGVMTVRLIEGM